MNYIKKTISIVSLVLATLPICLTYTLFAANVAYAADSKEVQATKTTKITQTSNIAIETEPAKSTDEKSAEVKAAEFSSAKSPESKELSSLAAFDKVLKPYKSATALIFKVNKIVTSELLEKETKYEGVIKYQKGKFRWRILHPEENLIVFDGKNLWNIQYPPKESKGKLQVTKTKFEANGKSPNILSALLGSRPVGELFEVKALPKTDGNIYSYELKEKGEAKMGLKNMVVEVNVKKARLVQISYVDEVENKTKLDFIDTALGRSVPAREFQYTPPKDAAVTEM